MLIFALLFVVVAMVSKIVGCGGMTKVLGFKGKDALKVGVGMMTRGEVALIVAQKAMSAGALTTTSFSAVILMIIVTPILLRVLYQEKKEVRHLQTI